MSFYMRCWVCIFVGCFVICRLPVYANDLTAEPQTEQGTEVEQPTEPQVIDDVEPLVDETVPQTDNLTDLQKLVVYKEFELFVLLPFLLAVVIFIWGCKWFTKTFCFFH